jgi:dTDP-4-amino-4,6-dideoxy-D-galactose acyltransferase
MDDYNKIVFLKWDSEHFDYKIGKIEVKDFKDNLVEIESAIKNCTYDLIYCFILQEEGCVEDILKNIPDSRWVDGKITFVKKVNEKQPIDLYHFKSITQISEKLYSLSIQSGEYSRFKTDPKFTYSQFERLYYKWIELSINGPMSDEVIAYVKDDNIMGMVTIGKKNGRIDVGLLSVDKQFRGRGIGKKLLEFVEYKAFQKGFKEIQVVTQNLNTPAVELYKKLGFTEESIINIFHIWK